MDDEDDEFFGADDIDDSELLAIAEKYDNVSKPQRVVPAAKKQAVNAQADPKGKSKQATLADFLGQNKTSKPGSGGKRISVGGKAKQITLLDSFKQGPKPTTSVLTSIVSYKDIKDVPPLPNNIRSSTYHVYDPNTITHYVYPVNYEKREYQFSILNKAIYENTLVCLPTGLGKTFIASVLMYNFYRWFPESKLIFMAPTKPLVNQQIDACFQCTKISHEDSCEVTGNQNPQTRQKLYRDHRVFFATPQVIENDLRSGVLENAKDIVCLVVDEAHRATGNYAYTQVVKLLREKEVDFRILGLSATPGSQIKTVQEVIENLEISKIELRTEESLDIKKYMHQRDLELVNIKFNDEFNGFVQRYEEIILEYLKNLSKYGALKSEETRVARWTKYTILQMRTNWQHTKKPTLPRNLQGCGESDFALLISLYHAHELLLFYGLKVFYSYIADYIKFDANEPENGSSKEKQMSACQKRLKGNGKMIALLEDISKSKTASHPKIDYLESLVMKHFSDCEEAGKTTKAIIFSEYRDSVDEIVEVLSKHGPLLKPKEFVGKAAGKNKKGITQKDQIKTVEDFQRAEDNKYNILVSTSIGEEGLDIGQVDLIICYDSKSSPVRMLQRMGRTGRKRDGKVFLLLTEGKETDNYYKLMSKHKTVQGALGNSVARFNFCESVRLIPVGLKPVPLETNIDVSGKRVNTVAKKASTRRISSDSSETNSKCELEVAGPKQKYKNGLFDSVVDHDFYKIEYKDSDDKAPLVDLDKLPVEMNIGCCVNIAPSRTSLIYRELLNFESQKRGPGTPVMQDRQLSLELPRKVSSSMEWDLPILQTKTLKRPLVRASGESSTKESDSSFFKHQLYSFRNFWLLSKKQSDDNVCDSDEGPEVVVISSDTETPPLVTSNPDVHRLDSKDTFSIEDDSLNEELMAIDIDKLDEMVKPKTPDLSKSSEKKTSQESYEFDDSLFDDFDVDAIISCGPSDSVKKEDVLILKEDMPPPQFVPQRQNTSRNRPIDLKKRKKKPVPIYIDHEAELSPNDKISSDEEKYFNDEELDRSLVGFVVSNRSEYDATPSFYDRNRVAFSNEKKATGYKMKFQNQHTFSQKYGRDDVDLQIKWPSSDEIIKNSDDSMGSFVVDDNVVVIDDDEDDSIETSFKKPEVPFRKKRRLVQAGSISRQISSEPSSFLLNSSKPRKIKHKIIEDSSQV